MLQSFKLKTSWWNAPSSLHGTEVGVFVEITQCGSHFKLELQSCDDGVYSFCCGFLVSKEGLLVYCRTAGTSTTFIGPPLACLEVEGMSEEAVSDLIKSWAVPSNARVQHKDTSQFSFDKNQLILFPFLTSIQWHHVPKRSCLPESASVSLSKSIPSLSQCDICHLYSGSAPASLVTI